ncbi:hypothetical protein Ae201684P_006959 [Aphanomyces euteiches]|nr:hypothetical protein Ae201684P_006959 [Aphanomyces euteiches]
MMWRSRASYPVEVKLTALGLLLDHSDYAVSALMGIPRRTIRNWEKQRYEILAFEGNKQRKKISNVGHEIFPDPPALVSYMTRVRQQEKALTCLHVINWIKRHHYSWMVAYLADKPPGRGYDSLLRLMQRFCDRHGFSRQRPGISKQPQHVLDSVHQGFADEFHREYAAFGKDCVYNIDETGMYYEMPPRVIWSVRGGDAKVSVGEKHGYRMTAALTIRSNGDKLPIMFVIRGRPGGRIETNEVPTYPQGHVYAVQENAWMDNEVWPKYLREVLKGEITGPSIILVDNFEAHVNEASYKIVNEELGSHLVAIPPNATSRCQPLDVGIMAPFKRHLRDLWLLEHLVDSDEMDEDELCPTAQLKRLAMIQRAIKAWDLITPEEIRASFEKALPLRVDENSSQ